MIGIRNLICIFIKQTPTEMTPFVDQYSSCWIFNEQINPMNHGWKVIIKSLYWDLKTTLMFSLVKLYTWDNRRYKNITAARHFTNYRTFQESNWIENYKMLIEQAKNYCSLAQNLIQTSDFRNIALSICILKEVYIQLWNYEYNVT